MRKLLLTGFEPFGGESINPSWEAVLRLPKEIGGFSIEKLLVPVVFGEAADLVTSEAKRIKADVVLSVGQAGGRKGITPELLGINLRHAETPDNRGNKPEDEPICEGGADALFSTLPARKISNAVKSLGIPSTVSYSAGAYVCNDLFYTLLARFKGSETRIGFIHIPYSPEQGKEPYMSLEDATRGLHLAIEVISEDIK